MTKNASIPVLERYLGKMFKTKGVVNSYLNSILQLGPRSLPVNTLGFLYKIEDMGDVDPSFPNRIVVHLLIGDQVFLKDCQHSEEFFRIFEPAEVG